MSDERFLTIDADHLLATWDCVLVQVWTGAPTAANMGALCERVRDFVSKWKGAACTLVIVEETSPPPPDAIRKKMFNVFSPFVQSGGVCVVVPMGGGFRGAMVRGVGLTLSTLAGKSLTFSFARSLEEACRLLGPYLSRASGGTPRLRAAIDELRAKMQPHSVPVRVDG